jgi:glycosyltransferase involved in cell wall biosynthesis
MSPALPPDPDRIAVFVSFSGAGGVERMVSSLARGFVALGQPLDLVLVRAEGPHLAGLPPEADRILLGARHGLTALPALARYLHQRRPAALLAAKDRAGRVAVLARALARTETRIVLRLGTNLSTAMSGRSVLERHLRYWPIRLLYPRLDGVVAVSRGVADDTARIARIPPEAITVIRNPVITPELFAQAALPCPHPWFRAGSPPVVVGMGRLQRQKDFPVLIRAFARVRQRRPCRLVILGDGSGRRGLLDLIDRLGLAGEVELAGFQANPYPFLASAALFVLSSAWEGSPNALTEAMALGTPVVSTDCPSGPRELLDGGRYGPLVPVGDIPALAAAMESALDRHPPPEALKAAVSEYNQDTSARHYLQALGVTTGPPPGASCPLEGRRESG